MSDSKFNEENVWDNNAGLFNKYFAAEFEKNKHYVTYLETDKVIFEDAVDDIKKQYLRLKPPE
jgi:protoporphyrinogen oxidase